MPLVSVADESVHTGRWPKTIDRESLHASDLEDQNVHTIEARPTGRDCQTEKDHKDSVGPKKQGPQDIEGEGVQESDARLRDGI